ncbi:MAG: alanine racemase [Streptosporangiaceae bacterium]
MRGLPPAIHPVVRSFLADGDRPATLLARWGSPLNLVFPEIFRANLASFRRVLDSSRLAYRIHYAHKVNQAQAFVRAALDAGIGIDVASPGELASAREAGFPVSRIEATGPKGRLFLRPLAEQRVTVNVDNPWELSELIRLARERGWRVPVLVRLCGFGAPGRLSRFGVPAARYPAVVDLLRAGSDAVDFLGLSFHLDTSDASEKIQAVDDCLRLFEQACAAGLAPRVLDIGGGFRQAFVDDAAAFDEYVQAMKDGLTGRGRPLTWDGNTLGYRFEDGRVQGVPVFHKYANRVTGEESLSQLLDATLPGQGGRRTAQVLRENMIELWLEPGKSLVDQAGVTLASVEFTKEAADGSLLVNLDLSRDKICPAGQEVMLDPVLIYRSAPDPGPGGPNDPAVRPGQRRGVFLGGNLCLERDMIFNHLTFVERLPGPGDIVAFVNTAAYQMDLSASEALMQRRAAKVAVESSGRGFIAYADRGDGPEEEEPWCFTPTSPS